MGGGKDPSKVVMGRGLGKGGGEYWDYSRTRLRSDCRVGGGRESRGEMDVLWKEKTLSPGERLRGLWNSV